MSALHFVTTVTTKAHLGSLERVAQCRSDLWGAPVSAELLQRVLASSLCLQECTQPAATRIETMNPCQKLKKMRPLTQRNCWQRVSKMQQRKAPSRDSPLGTAGMASGRRSSRPRTWLAHTARL